MIAKAKNRTKNRFANRLITRSFVFGSFAGLFVAYIALVGAVGVAGAAGNLILGEGESAEIPGTDQILVLNNIHTKSVEVEIYYEYKDSYDGTRHAVGDTGWYKNPFIYSGGLMDISDYAEIVYRSHKVCENDSFRKDVWNDGKEIIENEGYGNIVCWNRKEQQCYLDGSFDNYYDERCDFQPFVMEKGEKYGTIGWYFELKSLKGEKAVFNYYVGDVRDIAKQPEESYWSIGHDSKQNPLHSTPYPLKSAILNVSNSYIVQPSTKSLQNQTKKNFLILRNLPDRRVFIREGYVTLPRTTKNTMFPLQVAVYPTGNCSIIQK